MRIKPSKAGLFCGWRFVDGFKIKQFLRVFLLRQALLLIRLSEERFVDRHFNVPFFKSIVYVINQPDALP